jgi:N-acylneuraminate cytidylyltransferase/CMP-N,N'-diacetyllegionaminic acid synthase
VNSVVSVTKSKLSLNSILSISEDGALIRGTNATSTMNSNEHYYYPNGAIYIYNYYQYKKYRKTIIDKTFPYIMDNNRSIDIDTISDFDYANYLFNKQLKE